MDLEGNLTTALIQSLMASKSWKYAPEEGDYILKVSIQGIRDEEVGYNRSRQGNELNKWIVPNENRLSSCVKVELIDSKSQKCILGPKYVSSSVIYDYDPNFNVNNLVRFSLAQYNFQEVASRIAKTPLDQRLAEEIVSYLEFGW